MAKRIVVGARWLGREQKYVDFFSGYLAGLSVNFEESVNEKVGTLIYNVSWRGYSNSERGGGCIEG